MRGGWLKVSWKHFLMDLVENCKVCYHNWSKPKFYDFGFFVWGKLDRRAKDIKIGTHWRTTDFRYKCGIPNSLFPVWYLSSLRKCNRQLSVCQRHSLTDIIIVRFNFTAYHFSNSLFKVGLFSLQFRKCDQSLESILEQ